MVFGAGAARGLAALLRRLHGHGTSSLAQPRPGWEAPQR